MSKTIGLSKIGGAKYGTLTQRTKQCSGNLQKICD
jgi:hypothetical protein